MKLVVTGGCGFIGSALVRYLVRDLNVDVVNVDKLTYAASELNVQPVASSPRYSFVRADIVDTQKMQEVFRHHRPDGVIHLAAETHVDRSINGPRDFIDTNVVGTYVLLDCAQAYWSKLDATQRSAFRFVHVSTDEVYGALGVDGLFNEDSPYRPNSPYAATKAASDHLARAWHVTYGLPTIVTNASNNYGPYQFPEKLIPRAIVRALRGQSIEVYGRGENVRDWLHVEDHARGLAQVLTHGLPGRTYNFGGQCERQNIALVWTICDALDRARPGRRHADLIEFVTDRPGHDFRYALDASRAFDELNWKPSRTIEDGIATTVRWYMDNAAWWEPILAGSYGGERLGLATA